MRRYVVKVYIICFFVHKEELYLPFSQLQQRRNKKFWRTFECSTL